VERVARIFCGAAGRKLARFSDERRNMAEKQPPRKAAIPLDEIPTQATTGERRAWEEWQHFARVTYEQADTRHKRLLPRIRELYEFALFYSNGNPWRALLWLAERLASKRGADSVRSAVRRLEVAETKRRNRGPKGAPRKHVGVPELAKRVVAELSKPENPNYGSTSGTLRAILDRRGEKLSQHDFKLCDSALRYAIKRLGAARPARRSTLRLTRRRKWRR
jgi:hypothetical protein